MQEGYMDKIYNYYNWVETFSDPRPKGWFLIDSPIPSLYITGIYLLIVWIGPKIMKSRKPYELKTTIIIYNMFMTLYNVYMFIEYYQATTNLKYRFLCQPSTGTNTHPEELRIVRVTWLYYMSKVVEFCDSFFFILRKKDNQLSFLHIYHHSSMFMFSWLGTKWTPTGSSCFAALTNTFIHVIMYSYYALAAMGPTVAKYLWWKKYITMLQLIQFASLMSLSVIGMGLKCGFPPVIHVITFIYMTSYLFLFGRFYAKTYKSKEKKAVHSSSKDDALFNNNEMEKTQNNITAPQNGIMKKNV